MHLAATNLQHDKRVNTQYLVLAFNMGIDISLLCQKKKNLPVVLDIMLSCYNAINWILLLLRIWLLLNSQIWQV